MVLCCAGFLNRESNLYCPALFRRQRGLILKIRLFLERFLLPLPSGGGHDRRRDRKNYHSQK